MERERIATQIDTLADDRSALNAFFGRHPHLDGMNMDDLAAVLAAVAEEIRNPPTR